MFDLSKVTKAYSGKPGCLCGCRGKYSYAEGAPHADWQGKVNSRSVKIIFNKIMKNPKHEFDDQANCVYVDTPTRTLVAYFG
jgi:hypothetical protein